MFTKWCKCIRLMTCTLGVKFLWRSWESGKTELIFCAFRRQVNKKKKVTWGNDLLPVNEASHITFHLFLKRRNPWGLQQKKFLFSLWLFLFVVSTFFFHAATYNLLHLGKNCKPNDNPITLWWENKILCTSGHKTSILYIFLSSQLIFFYPTLWNVLWLFPCRKMSNINIPLFSTS